MVAAAPFRGLRFDPAVVGDLARVIAPPYDVISPEARVAYEAMSPYNVVRLILAPSEEIDPQTRSHATGHRPAGGAAAHPDGAARFVGTGDPAGTGDPQDRGHPRDASHPHGPGDPGDPDGPGDYRHVAELLAAWRDRGALRRDTAPCVYVYEEIYQLNGRDRVQRGVLASVTLDETGTWVVPHERTMAAPVADRLRLLEATGVNLSPVFGVYAGAGGPAAVLDDVTASEPAIDCVDETGVRHRLWTVADPGRISAWAARMASQRVLIADGHHRYRTSLAYRDAMRAAQAETPPGDGPARREPWDELLMFLVDADLHGPAVLPIHRLLADLDGATVLAGLDGDFDARPAATPVDAEERLGRLPEDAVAFGLYADGRSWLLVARDPAGLAAEAGRNRRMLDVEVLHGPVLTKRLDVSDFEGRVAYESDLAAAVARVDAGLAASLIILRPAPFGAVAAIAAGGETLPQKTTFFYPKPRDGLVLRPLG